MHLKCVKYTPSCVRVGLTDGIGKHEISFLSDN